MGNATQPITDNKDQPAPTMSQCTLSTESIYRLNSFFELMPPLVLREHLIELYHNYILHEHEALPLNFNELAEGLPLFLDFLKFADEEIRSHENETK